MYKSDLEAAITGREMEKARANKAEAELKNLKEGKLTDKRLSWPITYFLAIFSALFSASVISLIIFGKVVVVPVFEGYLLKTALLVAVAIVVISAISKDKLDKVEKAAILLGACCKPLAMYLVYLFFVR